MGTRFCLAVVAHSGFLHALQAVQYGVNPVVNSTENSTASYYRYFIGNSLNT